MNNEHIEILEIPNNELIEELDLTEKTEITNKFSIIKNYGEDLSSKTFITNPAIGREEEINKMILALISRRFRL